MKIQNLKLMHLRNDEHFQFFANFIELVNEFGAVELKIERQFDTLASLHSDEDEALKKILKSDFTRLLHEADSDRDGLFRGLAEANRTALNHFQSDVREAAFRLQIVFDTYGNVAKKGAAEEISAISSLINELVQNHKADMSTVGLNAWAEELNKRNRDFNKLEMDRDAETAVHHAGTEEVRARLDEAYRKIIERISALVLLDDGADNGKGSEETPGKIRSVVEASPYSVFIAKLNATIERYNNVLSIRRGKSLAKPKKPEDPA